MQNYFFYRMDDGEVIQTGLVPAYAIEAQIPPDGCAIAIGHAELGQHYIDGELINP